MPPWKASERIAQYPLQVIHSDIYGPFPESISHRVKYFITFIDEYSQYVIVCELRRKAEAVAAIKRFILMANNSLPHSGLSSSELASGNGSEYTSREC
jgi:hypothetical protein